MTMIHANELRIGNWIKTLPTRTERQVDLFMLSEWYDHENNDDYNYGDWLQGIPLTEERLLKLGLHKQTQNEWVINNEVYQFKGEKLHYTAGEGIFFGIGFSYVHLFQNFHFAISGQELEMKQP